MFLCGKWASRLDFFSPASQRRIPQRGYAKLLLPVQKTTNHSTRATAFSVPGCLTNIVCGHNEIGNNYFVRTFLSSARETLIENVCEQENNRLLLCNKIIAIRQCKLTAEKRKAKHKQINTGHHITYFAQVIMFNSTLSPSCD